MKRQAKSGSALVTKVTLSNYRSIAACDVALGPLTFLVGPNGAGKSNFLDGLRFVADALRTTLGHALRDRAGIHEVRRGRRLTGPRGASSSSSKAKPLREAARQAPSFDKCWREVCGLLARLGGAAR